MRIIFIGGAVTAQGALISPNNMTGDGAIFGSTVPSTRASSVQGADGAWKACDGVTASYSPWRLSAVPATWELYIGGSPLNCFSYKIQSRPDAASDYPTAWTLSIGTDGSSYTQIDSQTGQSFTQGEEKTYNCATPLAAVGMYFKLNVTAASSGDPALNEIKLYN